MDEARMRSLVGKLVSLQFDHGIRVLGTLTISEAESDSAPLYRVEQGSAGSVAPSIAAHRFRASAVTTIDEIS